MKIGPYILLRLPILLLVQGEIGLPGDRGLSGLRGMEGATGDQGMKGGTGPKGQPVSTFDLRLKQSWS